MREFSPSRCWAMHSTRSSCAPKRNCFVTARTKQRCRHVGKRSAMNEAFENHCWKDVVPREVLDLYEHYVRDLYVGPAPALIAIDLYELAYQGGPRPIAEIAATYPSSCGEHAWAAIKPTQRLFAAARAAG